MSRCCGSSCPPGAQELAQLEEGHPPLAEAAEVPPSDPRRDADRLVPLVAEATGGGHSVLVFCSSRKHCETAAALIADLLPQVGLPGGRAAAAVPAAAAAAAAAGVLPA